MSQPFSQLHVLRTSTESQEVASYIQGGILLLKKVLGGIGVVCGGAVHGRTGGRRVGKRRHLGRLGNRRRHWSPIVHLGGVVVVVIVVVLVVASSAKPLATGIENTSS